MTTTLLTLHQRLSEAIGDWVEEDTTTNIAANTSVVSTALNKWDRANDDYFNNWWLYITEGNNSAVEREISDYATSTGTNTVRGAALAAEAGAVTIRWGRYSWAEKVKSINNAIREVYPSLYRHVYNTDLIINNVLPNSHFTDWASSSVPDFYTASNVTAAETTTAALTRSGGSSVKVTASAANGYLYITSDDYPTLLDLMGQTVTFRAWAYPEVADDAFLTIYTIQADGTTQTLNSTTTCPAGKWTLLELEDQDINDDIVKIEFRFRILTNVKYAYFDNARAYGKTMDEYLLPTDLNNGVVSKAYIQYESYSEDPCDDLRPMSWEKVDGFRIFSDGTYKWLELPYRYESGRQIRLEGITPLETLTSQTDTISLDGTRVDLLIAYAAMDLFERLEGVPASEDVGRFVSNYSKWRRKYFSLLSHQGMVKPPQTMLKRVY